MPELPNRKRETMEKEDISTIKSAINAPSFGNTPEGIPAGLEDAPSPSMQKNPAKERESIPLKPMTHPQPAPQMIQRPIQPTQTTSTIPAEGTPQISEPSPERASFDVIEEIAESIISEKWEDLVKNVGDLKLWKERIDTDVSGIKQEIIRTQTRIENLQNAVMGKVSEYGEGINDVSSELRALEKVMEKIINPLTKSVKDLERITTKLNK